MVTISQSSSAWHGLASCIITAFRASGIELPRHVAELSSNELLTIKRIGPVALTEIADWRA